MFDFKVNGHDSIEKIIRKFKKKTKSSKVILEYVNRQHHVSKKEKQRLKKAQSILRKKRELLDEE